MSSLINYLATNPRTIAEAAIWAGRSISRNLTASFKDICTVCNNLQPHGHEDTFGRVGARLNADSDGWKSLRARAGQDATTLVLENISPKQILAARKNFEADGVTKRSCRYCRLLCDIFDAFFVDEYMSWITETLSGMPISVGMMIREGSPLIINCTGFTYDKYILHPRVDLEIYPENLGSLVNFPKSPFRGSVGSRSENAGSEECINFIKECIGQCCTEHDDCNISQTEFVPTRLLFLGQSNEDLRLCENESIAKGTKWAALSHCWGDGQPFKLDSENHISLKKSVNAGDLPATFLDAIVVSRKLGLEYLWIDSICIIQNSRPDWNVESSRMGSVYGLAFIVICAASSPNPETSFLGPREPEWLPKRFEFETANGEKLGILVRQRHLLAAPLEQGTLEPPFTSAWATLKRVGPLYSRGWCFQETFLALRVLHFAPGAIIFECRTHRRSEDQLPPWPSTQPDTLGIVSEAERWRMIVKAYTQRRLTFPKDKLPAIGGAASKMPQAGRTEYLAGLWRESLLLDLLWQVMPGGTHLSLSYPEWEIEHAPPTWSWASMDRGVTWNPLKSPQLLAEIIDAETSLTTTANTYGQVDDGRIVIRGRVTPCFLSTSYNDASQQWVYYLIKDDMPSKKHHFRVDGLLSLETGSGDGPPQARRARAGENSLGVQHVPAVFLCIAKTPFGNYSYVGLILSPSTDDLGSFVRVGNITNVPVDWYERGTEQTVTII